ncbi:DUF3267 domain-containing protein [Staphylococcus lutrae]|uniref:DUF3267 domain-containing protein n=1 Tax=Staphylococcus lutrae TaxID=155085 RepID=A0AAC9WIL9_9STAP|nr:DUF3267 domain-containing protein [Staphylococcus lutrae]ARJ50100.1 hypothetical protein B5P37_01425 [Staphylococcus lutrae]PNZ37051.1 DUF3267 domain-containing protein [Staphylococcus lutrae]
MLNCLRSIDIHSRFGLARIAFISFVTVIITFFVSFEIFHYYSNIPFTDQNFLLFIVLMLFIYPVHKLIHIITVFPYLKHLRVYKLVRLSWFPFYNIYLDRPIRKYYFCICLIMPFVVITLLCILIARAFPEYGHYFMFLLALNAGYSVMDILYLKVILFACQGHFVEEHQNGFVLLEHNSHAS